MFGISGNKAKTSTDVNASSSSQAGSQMDQGYGYDSMGGSFSGANTGYGSNARFGSNMFGGPAFNQMYGNLNNMWGGFQGAPMQAITESGDRAGGFMGDVADKGMSAYQNLMAGGASGATGAAVDPALRESLMASMRDPSNTGRMYEDIVGGAGNTYIDPMIDAMGSDEAIRQDRMASDITGNAVGSGMTGSSRHGIAEGLMRSEGNRNLAGREAEARAGAYDKDLDWKMNIAQQADLGRGQAQDRAIGLLGAGDQNTQYGLGQGANMQNMGMGMMAPSMQAGMMPFQMGGMYSGAMGNPYEMQYGSESTYGRGNEYAGQDYRDTGSGYGSGSSYQDAETDYNMRNRGSSMGFGFGM